MAALYGYEPVRCVRTMSGQGIPIQMRLPEDELNTFPAGTPVTIASGYVQESAFGGSELVLGIAAEAAHNLAVDGTAEELSIGDPPNQSSGVIIPVGSPIKDGKLAVYIANSQNVFRAKLKVDQTFASSLISATRYELKKDGTTLSWYIDTSSSGTNDEHCVNIIGQDPSTPNTAGYVAVFFVFAPAARFYD